MKRQGKHPDKALTAVKVRSVSAPGRYADGNGLYLVVDPSGAKRWVLRTTVNGKRRDMGLGGAAIVPLANARDLAAQYRRVARNGGDPISDRRKVRMAVPSFLEAAQTVHEEHRAAWRNAKHVNQWINSLSAYAFPFIGGIRIDQLDAPDIMRALSPIWLTKPETARRVRQRIGTVLDWAKASGFRTGDNPIDGVAKGLPKQPDRKNHFQALAYTEVPGFVRELRASGINSITALAFEFLILTAARTNEVLGARWEEVDLDRALWTIPAERMKAKREHRVPLAPRCVEILKAARTLDAESVYVFPGQRAGKPLSNMAFLMVIRRMGRSITAHGFRSAFADWAAERTNFPREVCEMALAHTIKNKVEAAYVRGDLFDKRRKLMLTWAESVAAAPARVISLRSDGRTA